jgi:hypothetical protein
MSAMKPNMLTVSRADVDRFEVPGRGMLENPKSNDKDV